MFPSSGASRWLDSAGSQGQDEGVSLMTEDMIQLLTPEGERRDHPDYPLTVDDDLLRAMYRDIVLTRRNDVESTALQRTGELGLWCPVLGQEGVQVGAGHAMRDSDYGFTTYREVGLFQVRGVDPVNLLQLYRGNSHASWDPRAVGLGLFTIVIGSHALHAVGYAMGIQRDGSDEAVLACFGDGASSTGDVHEAMVFAATFAAPVVFLVQNNQWAISVPFSRQSRTSLATRAAGYGIPSVRIDGNDVLAGLAVTRAALARAREGGAAPRLPGDALFISQRTRSIIQWRRPCLFHMHVAFHKERAQPLNGVDHV